jgi:hypothetical protein
MKPAEFIQDLRCMARANAWQKLKYPKPREMIGRVFSPPQDADDVLDVGGFQEF